MFAPAFAMAMLGATACFTDTAPVSETATSGECPAASAGCACTPGGSCDPGLACVSGVCVGPDDSGSGVTSVGPSTGSSSSPSTQTTSGPGTTDATTGDTGTDGSGPGTSTTGGGCTESTGIWLYATLANYDGNLTDQGNGTPRENADGICEQTPGDRSCTEFAALMSFTARDSIANLVTRPCFPTAVPVRSLSSVMIASDWDDLLDGFIAMSLEDAGVLAPSTQYWTGATASGGLEAFNCNGWTSEDPAESGRVGGSAATDFVWLQSGTQACGTPRRFVCLCW